MFRLPSLRRTRTYQAEEGYTEEDDTDGMCTYDCGIRGREEHARRATTQGESLQWQFQQIIGRCK